MKAANDFKTPQEYDEYLLTYFAAKAMQGVLAGGSIPTDEDLSKWSYGRAEAMLKERKKEHP